MGLDQVWVQVVNLNSRQLGLVCEFNIINDTSNTNKTQQIGLLIFHVTIHSMGKQSDQ